MAGAFNLRPETSNGSINPGRPSDTLASPGNPNLQIRVTGGQHGGETRGLFLAATLLARLFIMPMAAHNAQRALTINLFLQATQGFIHWLAFFQLNLGQSNSLPSRGSQPAVGRVLKNSGCAG